MLDAVEPSADDLILFTEIIDAGGFRAASAVTGIDKSVLSRRMQHLERLLGIALIQRSTRAFGITETGRRIYDIGAEMRAQARRARGVAQDSIGKATGILRLCCPSALAEAIVIPIALELQEANPGLVIDIFNTDGRSLSAVQHTEIVIQPSIGPLKDSAWVARRMTDVPYVLAAAPALAARLGHIESAINLAGAPAVGWGFNDHPGHWVLHHARAGTVEIDVDVRFHTNNLLQVATAAARGLGIAQLPVAMVNTMSEALVPILPGWAPPTISIYALFSSRNHLTLAGRLFLDAFAESTAGIGGRVEGTEK
ncbi:MAG: LysR substrate-binding domain-containing protein [Burkholderiales bacterium]